MNDMQKTMTKKNAWMECCSIIADFSIETSIENMDDIEGDDIEDISVDEAKFLVVKETESDVEFKTRDWKTVDKEDIKKETLPVTRVSHKKFLILATDEQFKNLVDEGYTYECETAGSLGAIGFDVSWSPAIAFINEETHDSLYVTPIKARKVNDKWEFSVTQKWIVKKFEALEKMTF